ncbi:MAG TPA: hypothetical protein VMV45_16065 [Casimicrobiaceae bacterium]|nr:hypothetical protein [Casimicrobiaceae bacterium]
MTPTRHKYSWLHFFVGLAIGFLLVAPVFAAPLDLQAVFGSGDSLIAIAAAMTMMIIVVLEIALSMQKRKLKPQRVESEDRMPRR